MEQEKWRLEKDYDDVSRELTVDPIRFNYGILKNKGIFLSMKDQKTEQTVEDSPKSE